MSCYADALGRAIEVFGSKARAEDWLEKMSADLGSAPNKLLKGMIVCCGTFTRSIWR